MQEDAAGVGVEMRHLILFARLILFDLYIFSFFVYGFVASDLRLCIYLLVSKRLPRILHFVHSSEHFAEIFYYAVFESFT